MNVHSNNIASFAYNPSNFPDIYFLIDEEGIIEEIDGAPSATLQKIIQFANAED